MSRIFAAKSALAQFSKPSVIPQSISWFAFGILTFSCFFMLPRLHAQRPTAPKLFPKDTFAYLRINDTREMKEKLAETGIGKIGNDPDLKRIISEAYNSLTDSLVQIQEEVGINLDELLSIPNGEFAVALVPSLNPNSVGLIPVLFIEAGDELPALEILMKTIESRFENRGSTRETVDVDGVEVIKWAEINRRRQRFGYFVDQGVMVISDPEITEYMAEVWTGNLDEYESLADNRKFTTIASKCVGTQGERPQAMFYVDPLAIARAVTRNDGAAQFAMALLPGLGVTGFKAVGGSVILAPEDFDSLTHVHILLESPRRGVLTLLRPASGSVTPQKWVNESYASYATANWNVEATVDAIEEIYTTFRGGDDEAFDEQVISRASDFFDVDFRADILEQIDDRFSFAQVYVTPYQINSGSNVYAISLKNGRKFSTSTLPKIQAKISERSGDWKTESLGGHIIYRLDLNARSDFLRSPEICVTVLGNELVIADSRQTLDMAINSYEGVAGRMSNALDFKIVEDQIAEQIGDGESSIISFQRPEESLRWFYEMAADDVNVNRLGELSENNPLFAALHRALKNNKLPDFQVIADYLAPSGSFVTEDETGLHITAFSIRRE